MDKIFEIQMKRFLASQLGNYVNGSDGKPVGAVEKIDLTVAGSLKIAGKVYSINFKLDL